MQHLTSRAAIVVWAFLVGATLLSGWVAEHQVMAGELSVPFMVVIIWLKGRGITHYYMELKSAPRGWHIAFEVWLLVVSLIIAGFWVFS